jgi:nitroreductase
VLGSDVLGPAVLGPDVLGPDVLGSGVPRSDMLGTMEFQDVVDRRRMVRNYSDEPVDPDVVERALRNATHAPSAGFSQGWAFLVLDTPDDVARWWAASTDPASLEDPDDWLAGMMRAPVVIVPCSSKAAYLRRYAEPDKGWTDEAEERWPMPFWHMDAAMASLLILQTAVDAGLGGCFFGVPVERVAAVREAFAIDPAFDPIGVITLGHRTGDSGNPGSPARRRRTPLADVVHRGRWTGR